MNIANNGNETSKYCNISLYPLLCHCIPVISCIYLVVPPNCCNVVYLHYLIGQYYCGKKSKYCGKKLFHSWFSSCSSNFSSVIICFLNYRIIVPIHHCLFSTIILTASVRLCLFTLRHTIATLSNPNILSLRCNQ